MPLPIRSLSDLLWFPKKALEWFTNPGGFWIAPNVIALLLFGVGAVALWRSGKLNILLALVLPTILVLLASAVHAYPFARRLLLFTLPCQIILISSGVGWIRNIGRPGARPRRIALALLLIGLFAYPVTSSAYYLFRPSVREESRPVVKYLQSQYKDGDKLYIIGYAVPAFKYYSMRCEFEPGGYNTGRRPLQDLPKLIGHRRVWIMFTHLRRKRVDGSMKYLRYLDSVGRRIDSHQRHNASVYLYDLSSPTQQRRL